MGQAKRDTSVRERWQQPSICQCNPPGDPWHAHYPDGSHGCARCDCDSWRSSNRPLVDAIRQIRARENELEAAKLAVDAAWARLGQLMDVPGTKQEDRRRAMVGAQIRLTEHAIVEREREGTA